MSATFAWAYILWVAGIMIGLGLMSGKIVITVGAAVITLVAFYALGRFGGPTNDQG